MFKSFHLEVELFITISYLHLIDGRTVVFFQLHM